MKILKYSKVLAILMISIIAGSVITKSKSLFLNRNHANKVNSSNIRSYYNIKNNSNNLPESKKYLYKLKQTKSFLNQIKAKQSKLKKTITKSSFYKMQKDSLFIKHTFETNSKRSIDSANKALTNEMLVISNAIAIINDHPYNYNYFLNKQNIVLPNLDFLDNNFGPVKKHNSKNNLTNLTYSISNNSNNNLNKISSYSEENSLGIGQNYTLGKTIFQTIGKSFEFKSELITFNKNDNEFEYFNHNNKNKKNISGSYNNSFESTSSNNRNVNDAKVNHRYLSNSYLSYYYSNNNYQNDDNDCALYNPSIIANLALNLNINTSYMSNIFFYDLIFVNSILLISYVAFCIGLTIYMYKYCRINRIDDVVTGHGVLVDRGKSLETQPVLSPPPVQKLDESTQFIDSESSDMIDPVYDKSQNAEKTTTDSNAEAVLKRSESTETQPVLSPPAVKKLDESTKSIDYESSDMTDPVYDELQNAEKTTTVSNNEAVLKRSESLDGRVSYHEEEQSDFFGLPPTILSSSPYTSSKNLSLLPSQEISTYDSLSGSLYSSEEEFFQDDLLANTKKLSSTLSESSPMSGSVDNVFSSLESKIGELSYRSLSLNSGINTVANNSSLKSLPYLETKVTEVSQTFGAVEEPFKRESAVNKKMPKQFTSSRSISSLVFDPMPTQSIDYYSNNSEFVKKINYYYHIVHDAFNEYQETEDFQVLRSLIIATISDGVFKDDYKFLLTAFILYANNMKINNAGDYYRFIRNLQDNYSDNYTAILDFYNKVVTCCYCDYLTSEKYTVQETTELLNTPVVFYATINNLLDSSFPGIYIPNSFTKEEIYNFFTLQYAASFSLTKFSNYDQLMLHSPKELNEKYAMVLAKKRFLVEQSIEEMNEIIGGDDFINYTYNYDDELSNWISKERIWIDRNNAILCRMNLLNKEHIESKDEFTEYKPISNEYSEKLTMLQLTYDTLRSEQAKLIESRNILNTSITKDFTALEGEGNDDTILKVPFHIVDNPAELASLMNWGQEDNSLTSSIVYTSLTRSYSTADVAGDFKSQKDNPEFDDCMHIIESLKHHLNNDSVEEFKNLWVKKGDKWPNPTDLKRLNTAINDTYPKMREVYINGGLWQYKKNFEYDKFVVQNTNLTPETLNTNFINIFEVE